MLESNTAQSDPSQPASISETAVPAKDALKGDMKEESPNAQETWDKMSLPQQRAAVFRVQHGRETVEAFVVAFVLALLFRAFIAEAFVIPTGSMAPALMGAHKDIFCEQCGQQFPIGASLENRDVALENAVVGGVCPNCRYVNPLDLAGNPDHGTFSGDRILVSKYAYALSDPKRWDVIVFKVPVNPKQNYIKRLVGLPNETLSVRHGDVFGKPIGDPSESEPVTLTGGDSGPSDIGEILRKPPSKLLAMSHAVYDSNHQANALLSANYPARLQPWRSGEAKPPTDSWKVEQSSDGLIASVNAASGNPTQWLRYFHRWPTPDQWASALKGLSLAGVNPYSSRLITDFHAYDSYLFVDADRIYDIKPSNSSATGGRLTRLFKTVTGQGRGGGVFRPIYKSGEDLSQFRNALRYGSTGYATEGVHWVGDLIVQTDVETDANAKALTLEIVEAGVQYRCDFDLTSGMATLSIRDANDREFDGGNITVAASTTVVAGSRHEIRLSNCDDQLTLWVDGDVVSFSQPTTFDVSSWLSPDKIAPVYGGPANPLDASPIAVGVRDGKATLHRLTIDRDKYYIATKDSSFGMLDYEMRQLNDFAGATVREEEIQAVMGQPTIWSEFPGWAARRTVSFDLGEDQFFPMGDNSPESLDARCWAGTKERYGRNRSVDKDSYKFADASYVPRDLLVGKALAIFWPHPWREPIPITPNFQRMRLIR